MVRVRRGLGRNGRGGRPQWCAARGRANIGAVTSLALVLSAGGPIATAFHGGVLAALLEETGWDARHATLIVGTSAGSSAGSRCLPDAMR